MNYRKFYEEQTKTKLPKNFEVHHIDLNRENNDISNLVAIPKKLHQELHSRFDSLYIPENKFELLPQGILGTKGSGFNWFVFNQFKLYEEVCSEVSKWIDHRDYLRGLIMNINNLKY